MLNFAIWRPFCFLAAILFFIFFKQVQSTNSCCPNLYGQSEQILTKFWKIKWPLNHKIEHNSLISWATESRFCMEVRMDSLNKFWQNLEKQNGCQKTKWPPNHKIKLIWTGASAILTCEIFWSRIFFFIIIYICLNFVSFNKLSFSNTNVQPFFQCF